MVYLILVLLFSHLFTDFVLQNDDLAERKKQAGSKGLRALGWHSLVFFITSISVYLIVFVWLLQSYNMIISNVFFILVLSISHLIIDFAKTRLETKDNKLYLFITDQILHVVAILIVIYILYPLNALKAYNYLIGYLNGVNQLKPLLNPLQKVLFISSMLIIVTSFSNVLIQLSIKPIKDTITKNTSNNNDDNKELKIGRYIGSYERLLTVIAIYLNSYQSLVGLYGIKTAARFKKIEEDPDFAEYYLLAQVSI